jgi:hypothetical protein
VPPTVILLNSVSVDGRVEEDLLWLRYDVRR